MGKWLAEWIEEGQTQQRALELGAGTGIFTEFLKPHCEQLTASDGDVEMVKEGKRRQSGVTWKVLDAWGALPFSPTCIYSSSLLQWCPNFPETLKRWAPEVERGTRALHGFYLKGTLEELEESLGIPESLEWKTQEAWEQAFAQGGWKILKAESERRAYVFGSILHLLRYLRAIGSTTVRRVETARLLKATREHRHPYPTTWHFCRLLCEKIDGA